MRHQDVIRVLDDFLHAVPQVNGIGETTRQGIRPAVFFVRLQVIAQEHQIADDPVITLGGID